MIIDTHCHFDMMPNPEAFIREKEAAHDIVIGMTNLPSHFKMGMAHVATCKSIRLALGLHPLLAAESRDELVLFKKLLDQTSYIGEIGLDFSREGIATKEQQIAVLRDILASLRGKKKVISVHSRRAEKELLEILTEFEIENVIFHWYSGPIKLIPSILDRGYYFSVNEAMCISKNGKAIIAQIPRERVLTETDAPYNEHCDFSRTLQALGMSEQEVHNNFKRILGALVNKP